MVIVAINLSVFYRRTNYWLDNGLFIAVVGMGHYVFFFSPSCLSMVVAFFHWVIQRKVVA